MKQLKNYLINHVKSDFHFSFYLYSLIFLIICFYLNYGLFNDCNSRIITSFKSCFLDANADGKDIFTHIYYFLFYAFSFYSICFAYFYFYNRWDILKNKSFIFKSLFGILIYSLSSSISFDGVNNLFTLPNNVIHYWTVGLKKLFRVLFVLLPIYFVFKWFKDDKSSRFYGLHFGKFNWKIYFKMFLIMIPLIFIASFESQFKSFYPIMSTFGAESYYQKSPFILMLYSEICYGFNFVTVEFFFRGFLIFGMVEYFGKSAVLPMVSFYAFIHFGKPIGEAISSVFGGYILGVISLKTESILGGIYLHILVAWMMELMSLI